MATTLTQTRPSTHSWLPLAAAAVTMVLWASAFVVIRALSGAIDPGPLASGRLLVGALVLTALVLARSRRHPIRIPRGRQLLLMITYGALWFGFYTVAVTAAGKYLDAGTSAMLVNLSPVIIAVLAGFLLREGFPRQLMMGLTVAFAGVVIIASASYTGEIEPLGVALALLAAGLNAVGMLLQKQALKGSDPVTVTWLGAVAGATATLPYAGGIFPQLAGQTWTVTAGVVYLGVFPSAIGFLLWTYALSRTSAGRMAVSTYLVPGLAVLISWAFLGEVPTGAALIGGAVSLAGVAITRVTGLNRKGRREPVAAGRDPQVEPVRPRAVPCG